MSDARPCGCRPDEREYCAECDPAAFDVEAAAAAHYAEMIGLNRTIEERRDEARRLSAYAPTVDRRDDITDMLRSHRGDANRDMLGDEL